MMSYTNMAKVASASAGLSGSNTSGTGSASNSAPLTKAEIGAQVVSQTLDNLNGVSSSSSSAPTSKAEFGAQVVSKTLDYMNKGKSKKSNSISPSYETQMTILKAGMANKGAVISSTG